MERDAEDVGTYHYMSVLSGSDSVTLCIISNVVTQEGMKVREQNNTEKSRYNCQSLRSLFVSITHT